MCERLQFIQACLDRRVSVAEVCAEFGISEKTGHKWLARFRADGPGGLADRSRAPKHSPGAMAPAVADRILALKRRFPLSGPGKLRDWLVQHHPTDAWPAASTIGALLLRHGLVQRRPHRRGAVAAAARATLVGRTAALAPNDVWTADFKGEFRLQGHGAYCYPLTVLDLHSHLLLRCTALSSTALAPTRRVFEHLFREHGLPRALRTDNGLPFAHPLALGRLGALGLWWARLGIRPEHITPARPAENGAHERFHRTLKAHTLRPPAPSLAAQQRAFDRFRTEYNTERPHASLPTHCPPQQAYAPSSRPYPTRLPPLEYPGAVAIRRVASNGSFKWRAHPIFLSGTLADQDIGLYEHTADRLTVRYAQLVLGELELHDHRFTGHVRWHE
jgi:putative transposase